MSWSRSAIRSRFGSAPPPDAALRAVRTSSLRLAGGPGARPRFNNNNKDTMVALIFLPSVLPSFLPSLRGRKQGHSFLPRPRKEGQSSIPRKEGLFLKNSSSFRSRKDNLGLGWLPWHAVWACLDKPPYQSTPIFRFWNFGLMFFYENVWFVVKMLTRKGEHFPNDAGVHPFWGWLHD